MAKTNDSGEQVNETLAADTLAHLFADEMGKVEIMAGPNNDTEGAINGVDGFRVRLRIPREYGQYKDEIETKITTNWSGTNTKGKPIAERVAYFEQYVATEWEPKTPSLRSTVEQAVHNRLFRVAVEKGQLKETASEKDRNRELDPIGTSLLNDPSVTERARPVIDAYLADFQDYSPKNLEMRIRKNATGTPAAENPEKVADLKAGF